MGNFISMVLGNENLDIRIKYKLLRMLSWTGIAVNVQHFMEEDLIVYDWDDIENRWGQGIAPDGEHYKKVTETLADISKDAPDIMSCISYEDRRKFLDTFDISIREITPDRELKDRQFYIDSLVASIVDDKPDERRFERRRAIELLRESNNKTDEDIDLLSNALTDSNPENRIVACEVLVKMEVGRKEIIKSLIDALKDTSRSVRMYAAEALGRIGDERAVIGLIDALKGKDKEEYRVMVKALGEIGGQQASQVLIEALKDEEFVLAFKEDRDVFSDVIKALYRTRDEQTFPWLFYALRSGRIEVKEDATEALVRDRRCVDLLIDMLRRETWQVDLWVVPLLGEIGDRRALEPLIKATKAPLFPGFSEDTLELKKVYYIELVRAAQNAINKIKSKKTTNRLIDESKYEDKARGRIIEYKTPLYSRKVYSTTQNHFREYFLSGKEVEEVILAAQFDCDWEAIIDIFVEDGSERTIKGLIRSLKNDRIRRSVAIKALGRIRDIRATELLIGLLEDKNTEIRESAADALGNIRDKRAVGPLINALKDENGDVRKSAAKALGLIEDKQALRVLINTLQVKNALLGKANTRQSIGHLINLLDDENEDVRRETEQALRKIVDGRTIELLQKAKESKDQWVRDRAIKVLDVVSNAKHKPIDPPNTTTSL